MQSWRAGSARRWISIHRIRAHACSIFMVREGHQESSKNIHVWSAPMAFGFSTAPEATDEIYCTARSAPNYSRRRAICGVVDQVRIQRSFGRPNGVIHDAVCVWGPAYGGRPTALARSRLAGPHPVGGCVHPLPDRVRSYPKFSSQQPAATIIPRGLLSGNPLGSRVFFPVAERPLIGGLPGPDVRAQAAGAGVRAVPSDRQLPRLRQPAGTVLYVVFCVFLGCSVFSF